MTTADANRPGGVVITWIAHHGRSERLGQRNSLQAVFMPWAMPRRPLAQQVMSWSRSAVRTWHVIRALPAGALVIAVSPPVFNPLVCLAASGRRQRVVLDAHSGTFNDRRWAWSHPLVRACARRCAAVLVTNDAVSREVLAAGARVLVLHDPLVEDDSPSQPDECQRASRPYVVFPASGAPDEPISAVCGAAELLRGEIDVVVTGRRGSPLYDGAISFTGYLPQADYLATLRGAEAVLALTTREGTMQRAAYEALEVGARLVCSDTSALRETFGPVAEYSPADAAELAAAIRRALNRPREECRAQAQHLRRRLNSDGAEVLALLRAGLPELSIPTSARGVS